MGGRLLGADRNCAFEEKSRNAAVLWADWTCEWHMCRWLYCFPCRWATIAALLRVLLEGADELCEVGVQPRLHCHRRSLRRGSIDTVCMIATYVGMNMLLQGCLRWMRAERCWDELELELGIRKSEGGGGTNAQEAAENAAANDGYVQGRGGERGQRG